MEKNKLRHASLRTKIFNILTGLGKVRKISGEMCLSKGKKLVNINMKNILYA